MSDILVRLRKKIKRGSMKIIVFGGSGFLGSHVADALTEAGHDVTIYDIKKSCYVNKHQKQIVGDILDEAKVKRAIKGCDVVYNFAGLADIEEAQARPIETIRNNVLGNTFLLEAARINKIKRFVFASSVYVYSEAGGFYRSSKQACELIIENYRKIYGLNYTILRFGSLYGPRADEKNWIYTILKQAMRENKITRYGDGEELREYVHVYDAASCSVEILKKEYENQNIIITGHLQMKIKDLLVMIKEMMGNKIKIEYKSTPNGVHYNVTPYSFYPKMAKKLVSHCYMDMGQGILDLLSEISLKQTKNEIKKIVLKKK